jgi:hypothetical protein
MESRKKWRLSEGRYSRLTTAVVAVLGAELG